MKKALSAVLSLVLILLASVPCVALLEDFDKKDFIYSTTKDGVSIIAYTGTKKEVVVPDKIDGEFVIEVCKGAFEGNNNIVTVILSDWIRTVEQNAFKDCKSLKNVHFSGYVNISSLAFTGCSSLERLYLPIEEADRHKFFYFQKNNIKQISGPAEFAENTKEIATRMGVKYQNACEQHDFNEFSTNEHIHFHFCKVCAYSEVGDHNLDLAVIEKHPICDEAGINVRTCKMCNWQKTASIKPLGHTYELAEIIKMPTATTGGTVRMECSFCGDSVVTDVEELGEGYEDVVISTPHTDQTDIPTLQLEPLPQETEGVSRTLLIAAIVSTAVAVIAAVMLIVVLKKKKSKTK